MKKTDGKSERGTGLIPLTDVLPAMEALIPVLKEARQSQTVTVQGRHHCTTFKQLDTLSEIGEEQNSDMGFMSRLLTLCSLPRTDPGDRMQYKRQNGPYKLIMIAGGDNKLPFGNIPRLLLA
jgi:hypothetical protein